MGLAARLGRREAFRSYSHASSRSSALSERHVSSCFVTFFVFPCSLCHLSSCFVTSLIVCASCFRHVNLDCVGVSLSCFVTSWIVCASCLPPFVMFRHVLSRPGLSVHHVCHRSSCFVMFCHVLDCLCMMLATFRHVLSNPGSSALSECHVFVMFCHVFVFPCSLCHLLSCFVMFRRTSQGFAIFRCVVPLVRKSIQA